MVTAQQIIKYCKSQRCKTCGFNGGDAFNCMFKRKPVYWEYDKIEKVIRKTLIKIKKGKPTKICHECKKFKKCNYKSTWCFVKKSK